MLVLGWVVMSKSKSNRLRIGELRRIHELIGECEELWDDPAGWQAHLAAEGRGTCSTHRWRCSWWRMT